LPSIVNSKGELYATNFYEEENGCVLTVYQGRLSRKNVVLFSTFHEKVCILQNEVKLPNIIDDYNETKVGIDIVDNMIRKTSVRCKTNRWTVQFFFKILNMIGINS
jgi:hypothetical protein